MTTPDVRALWQQADQAQADAQARYPGMACRNGCNDCCKHHGSPITYASEWAQIQSWLEAHPQILSRIEQRFHAVKQMLQTRLHQPEVPSLFEALFEIPCPCIEVSDQGERCGIYPVRPLTCRSFGNTLIQAAPTSQDEIYTCTPEKERWEKDLPMLSELDLPLRATLFVALETQDQRRSLMSFLERFLYQRSQKEIQT